MASVKISALFALAIAVLMVPGISRANLDADTIIIEQVDEPIVPIGSCEHSPMAPHNEAMTSLAHSIRDYTKLASAAPDFKSGQANHCTISGVASWYGPHFQGHKTANGERFNTNALTAASKTLPLGSKVRVTNPQTGQSVVVRINDRGPYVKGRILDLSHAAAQAIGISGTGSIEIDRCSAQTADISRPTRSIASTETN